MGSNESIEPSNQHFMWWNVPRSSELRFSGFHVTFSGVFLWPPFGCVLSNVRCYFEIPYASLQRVFNECFSEQLTKCLIVICSTVTASHSKNIDNGLFVWLHLGCLHTFLDVYSKQIEEKDCLWEQNKAPANFCFLLSPPFLSLLLVQTFLLPSLPNTCSYHIFWVGFQVQENVQTPLVFGRKMLLLLCHLRK